MTASACNLQRLDGRPVIIDTLPIGPQSRTHREGLSPQLCKHILAPPALGPTCAPALTLLLRLAAAEERQREIHRACRVFAARTDAPSLVG